MKTFNGCLSLMLLLLGTVTAAITAHNDLGSILEQLGLRRCDVLFANFGGGNLQASASTLSETWQVGGFFEAGWPASERYPGLCVVQVQEGYSAEGLRQFHQVKAKDKTLLAIFQGNSSNIEQAASGMVGIQSLSYDFYLILPNKTGEWN